MTTRSRYDVVRRTVLTAALAICAFSTLSFGQADTGTGARGTETRHADRGFNMGWLGCSDAPGSPG